MLKLIQENLATIIVGLVVLAILVMAVVSMVRSKKKGTSCGSGCCGCPHSKDCHKT